MDPCADGQNGERAAQVTNPVLIEASMGATIEAVVTMATVEDPWAARIAAAARKGSHNPIVIEDMPLPIVSAIPEFRSTSPNAPPAPGNQNDHGRRLHPLADPAATKRAYSCRTTWEASWP